MKTLGIFVWTPAAEVQDSLVRGGATLVKDLRNVEDDDAVTIAGLVTGVRRTMTKNGAQILIAQLEDTTGSVETIVFASSHPQVQALFRGRPILVVKGRVRRRERPGSTPGRGTPLELSVQANEVAGYVPSARVDVPPKPRGWHVTIAKRDQVDRLAALLDEWPGDIRSSAHAARSGSSWRVRSVRPARPHELARIVGNDNIAEGAPSALTTWRAGLASARVRLQARDRGEDPRGFPLVVVLEILTPTFESTGSPATGLGERLMQQTFRFNDPLGQSLALRTESDHPDRAGRLGATPTRFVAAPSVVYRAGLSVRRTATRTDARVHPGRRRTDRRCRVGRRLRSAVHGDRDARCGRALGRAFDINDAAIVDGSSAAGLAGDELDRARS